LGGVIGAGGFALYNNIFGGSTANDETAEGTTALLQGQRESTALKTSYVATDSEMTASQVYASNVNSTVGITTSVTTNYLGFQTTAAVSGSGFILTENGYIVTNYHVIEDASDIKVTTYDDTAYEAELIGYDEDNDLAVLKIDAKDLTPVILGDSDQINVGDSVIAIGNPLGELTFSLTQGAVSALNRKVTINNTAMTLIQTDCAINSGNSGGALFNTHGEVIGITNAKYSSSSLSGEASVDNIGFAIPINSVRENIESIIENGYVMKPYIGISVYDVDTRNQTSNLTGIAIQEVEEDSPAAAAGLKEGDIITKVNETEISSTSEFQSILSDAKEGDILTLTISRQGETVEAKVELAMRKQSALPESDTSSSKQEQTGQTPFSEGFPG
jgi:serine protease Do